MKSIPDHRAQIDIPDAWRDLPLDGMNGLLMIVGGPDAGKTTLAFHLYQTLLQQGRSVALLDGDPGQSSLGPPAAMTLIVGSPVSGQVPGPVLTKRCFVGSNSPSGHMLQLLTSASRLVSFAVQSAAQVIIYDTSGLVDPKLGGLALKLAKIDLLRPAMVIAIQRAQELQPLIVPLQRSRCTRVLVLEPSPLARERPPDLRRLHRQQAYSSYFHASHEHTIDWSELAVFPAPLFRINRLVALEDCEGFTLALGIVTHIDRDNRIISLKTPLGSLQNVNALRLGDLLLDPQTYSDERI